MNARLESPPDLIGSDPRERAVVGELQLIRRRLDDVLNDIRRVLRQTEHEEEWEQVGQAARIALRGVRAATAAVPAKPQPQAALPDVIGAEELRVDTCTRRQWWAGDEFSLSSLQHRLLAVLASEPRRVFGKDELLREVWGYHSVQESRTPTEAISRLRRALETAGAPKGLTLVSRRNVGWSLLPRPDSDGGSDASAS